MSLPSIFHPGTSRQARHLSPTVIAMPKPELASEYALQLMIAVGLGMDHIMVGERKSCFHHLRLLSVSQGGV